MEPPLFPRPSLPPLTVTHPPPCWRPAASAPYVVAAASRLPPLSRWNGGQGLERMRHDLYPVPQTFSTKNIFTNVAQLTGNRMVAPYLSKNEIYKVHTSAYYPGRHRRPTRRLHDSFLTSIAGAKSVP